MDIRAFVRRSYGHESPSFSIVSSKQWGECHSAHVELYDTLIVDGDQKNCFSEMHCWSLLQSLKRGPTDLLVTIPAQADRKLLEAALDQLHQHLIHIESTFSTARYSSLHTSVGESCTLGDVLKQASCTFIANKAISLIFHRFRQDNVEYYCVSHSSMYSGLPCYALLTCGTSTPHWHACLTMMHLTSNVLVPVMKELGGGECFVGTYLPDEDVNDWLKRSFRDCQSHITCGGCIYRTHSPALLNNMVIGWERMQLRYYSSLYATQVLRMGSDHVCENVPVLTCVFAQMEAISTCAINAQELSAKNSALRKQLLDLATQVLIPSGRASSAPTSSSSIARAITFTALEVPLEALEVRVLDAPEVDEAQVIHSPAITSVSHRRVPANSTSRMNCMYCMCCIWNRDRLYYLYCQNLMYIYCCM